MNKELKIAVVGSRTYDKLMQIQDFIRSLDNKAVTIVSGGAKGVDFIAEQAANMYGFKTEIYLPDWNKRDSYGICYIGERNIPRFLSQFIKPNPGNIIDKQGKVLGQHSGLHNYTFGQRQGIGIGGGEGPFFVLNKDYQNNNLVITNDPEDPELFTGEMKVSRINWINDQEILELVNSGISKFNCLVRTRHLKKFEKCQVKILNVDSVKIIFKRPQRALTPGQVAVFYQEKGWLKKEYKVLGGGIMGV